MVAFVLFRLIPLALPLLYPEDKWSAEAMTQNCGPEGGRGERGRQEGQQAYASHVCIKGRGEGEGGREGPVPANLCARHKLPRGTLLDGRWHMCNLKFYDR